MKEMTSTALHCIIATLVRYHMATATLRRGRYYHSCAYNEMTRPRSRAPLGEKINIMLRNIGESPLLFGAPPLCEAASIVRSGAQHDLCALGSAYLYRNALHICLKRGWQPPYS